MSWSDDVKEIERQRRMAEEMGGADSVAFQHGRGKLTVRERVDLLADPGSFHEIGALAGTATWEDDRVAQSSPRTSSPDRRWSSKRPASASPRKSWATNALRSVTVS